MRAKSNATRRYSAKPDSDLPEMTEAMFRRGHYEVGGKRVSRAEGAAAFRKALGRPKSENPKKLLTLRLSPDVIERWRATGPGWQTRMAEKLSRVA